LIFKYMEIYIADALANSSGKTQKIVKYLLGTPKSLQSRNIIYIDGDNVRSVYDDFRAKKLIFSVKHWSLGQNIEYCKRYKLSVRSNIM